MPTRTASATGTIKNTSSKQATFRVNLLSQAYTATAPRTAIPTEAKLTSSEHTIAIGASMALPLPLKTTTEVPEGGSIEAWVELDMIAPVSKIGIATTQKAVWNEPSYGGELTGWSTTIARRLSGVGATGDFSLQIGDSNDEQVNWTPFLIGAGIAGLIMLMPKRRRHAR